MQKKRSFQKYLSYDRLTGVYEEAYKIASEKNKSTSFKALKKNAEELAFDMAEKQHFEEKEAFPSYQEKKKTEQLKILLSNKCDKYLEDAEKKARKIIIKEYYTKNEEFKDDFNEEKEKKKKEFLLKWREKYENSKFEEAIKIKKFEEYNDRSEEEARKNICDRYKISDVEFNDKLTNSTKEFRKSALENYRKKYEVPSLSCKKTFGNYQITATCGKLHLNVLHSSVDTAKSTGFKLHISLEQEKENLVKAWDIVAEIIQKYSIVSAKVVHHELLYDKVKNKAKAEPGKEITIYQSADTKNSDDWTTIIAEIEQSLSEAGVKPNDSSPQGDKKIKGSRYIGYRNDFSPFINEHNGNTLRIEEIVPLIRQVVSTLVKGQDYPILPFLNKKLKKDFVDIETYSTRFVQNIKTHLAQHQSSNPDESEELLTKKITEDIIHNPFHEEDLNASIDISNRLIPSFIGPSANFFSSGLTTPHPEQIADPNKEEAEQHSKDFFPPKTKNNI